jgi:hypothetical protein
MKKLLLVSAAVVLLSIFAVAAPAGAGEKNVFQSDLSDNPGTDYPTTLANGEVTINPEFMAAVTIKTDAICQTYDVTMQVGPVNRRYNVRLGTISTNEEGSGRATFDLKDYDPEIATPRIIGPYFSISTPGKPLPEFDTSYVVFPNSGPPEPGRIILMAGAPAYPDASFSLDMSYGYDAGYPAGVSMKQGEEVGSLFTLMPGVYTITERYQSGWNLPNIIIDDPTSDSLRTGRFTVIVNVAPGETVTVRYINSPR